MVQILVLTLLILFFSEMGPPIYRASVLEGLAITEGDNIHEYELPKLRWVGNEDDWKARTETCSSGRL